MLAFPISDIAVAIFNLNIRSKNKNIEAIQLCGSSIPKSIVNSSGMLPGVDSNNGSFFNQLQASSSMALAQCIGTLPSDKFPLDCKNQRW